MVKISRKSKLLWRSAPRKQRRKERADERNRIRNLAKAEDSGNDKD